jgi:hypothetical protein
LRLAAASRLEDAAGSWGTGRVAAQLPELSCAAAEYLAAHKLPAALARGLLDTLTLEYVDDVHSLAPDDWRALVDVLEEFTAERFDEALAALADDGPLVPVSGDRP